MCPSLFFLHLLRIDLEIFELYCPGGQGPLLITIFFHVDTLFNCILIIRNTLRMRKQLIQNMYIGALCNPANNCYPVAAYLVNNRFNSVVKNTKFSTDGQTCSYQAKCLSARLKNCSYATFGRSHGSGKNILIIQPMGIYTCVSSCIAFHPTFMM